MVATDTETTNMSKTIQGVSQKTMEELFMILDPAKQFLTNGHHKAMAAKKERESKSKESHGPKGDEPGLVWKLRGEMFDMEGI